MPHYRWTGITTTGQPAKGVSTTNSIDELKEELLAQHIALLTCKEGHRTFTIERKPSPQQLIDFYENLSLLLISGIELAPALEIVQSLTASSTLRSTINMLAKHIKQGQPLHVAISQHPNLFSPLVVQHIAVGEKTGKLATVLVGIKEYLQAQKQLRDKLKQAALMPGITLMVAVALVASIFVFLMPHLASIYQSLGCTIPASTRLALHVTGWINSGMGVAMMVGCMGGYMAAKRLIKKSALKPMFDSALLKIPYIKNIVMNREIIRCLQTLSLSLSSGIPLGTALEHTQAIAQNTVYKKALTELSLAINQGKTMVQALQESRHSLFEPHLMALISVGESTGNLDHVLKNAHQHYQAKLDKSIHTIATLFSPLLMVAVGLLIGGLMVVIYLPIFNLGNLFYH